MLKLSHLIIDAETIPDNTLPISLKPAPKYGNVKDQAKREKIAEEWEGSSEQIKSLSLSPATNKIVSIQCYSSKADGLIDMPMEEEHIMLDVLWNAMADHTLIVGFNHMSFDLPVIKMRSMLLGVQPTMPVELIRYRNHPFYDVMQELAGWDNTRWKSQDWWAERMGVSMDKEMDGSMVYEYYQEGRIDEIHKYCRTDVMELKAIFNKMIRYYPIR